VRYAEAAVADRKGTWTGVLLRQAAARFLKDLARTQRRKPPFTFSKKWANAHCKFIEQMPHTEGEWSTESITLEAFQIFFIVQLFGFRKADGTRRFTEAVYATARKNAKSTLAAAILNSCLCLEKENGAQVISAATTGGQARIVWKHAKTMIDRRPELRETFDVETFANSIARFDTGATFKPINSKASTQDGLNPSHTNLDEVHAHKSSDLLNVLRSAAGARKNPLWLYTTTEGYESPGPWPELREFAKRVLLGVVEADHLLAVLWMMDDDDDEYDEKNWPKANPLIEVNPIIRTEMRKMATAAQNMPSTAAEFRIKRCNLPAASAKAWVNLKKWNRCSEVPNLKALIGAPCWGGLDLASTTDMAAWRLIWWWEQRWWTWGRYWVPAEQVKQRTEANRVNYAGWVAAKYVQQTEGDITDYDRIEADILADCKLYNPRKIAYDPWNATQLVTRLGNHGLELEIFIQGPRSYHPAMQAIEVAYHKGLLAHGGDPVLRWNASNLVPRKDVNMNQAPDKKRSADKIDGMCALLMAAGVAVREVEESDDAAGFFANPVVAHAH
jgi:phage terminase large subunit-like protein